MLESAESEHPRLTVREIIFEDFQRRLCDCDHDTSTQRPGQTDDLLCVAMRDNVNVHQSALCCLELTVNVRFSLGLFAVGFDSLSLESKSDNL